MFLRPRITLMLGGAAFVVSPAIPIASHALGNSSLAGSEAGCRVVLRGRGLYQLEVGKAGPVPVVTFKQARAPRFDPISWQQGRPGSCNYPLGDLTVDYSRNASAMLYHISLEIHAEAESRWVGSQRPQLAFPFQKLGNLTIPITQGALLQGIREGVAAAAAELIKRYANPASFLTDAGAKWVAEQGIKLMLQAYVEGRDPGLIIDGLLADMVKYLQGQGNKALKAAGGTKLEQSLKPLLKQMAADLTKALVETQPELQTVMVTGTNNEDDCSHFLTITWSMKGWGYDITLTIRCGEQQNDFIGSVNVNAVTVDPGGAGAITATALSQLGVAMPLASATIAGVAPVQAAGAGEPPAVLAPALATFNFVAGDPRADRVYDNQATIRTTALVGNLSGNGRGSVTIRNVAPTIVGAVPNNVSAVPGDLLELKDVAVTVHDQNADASPEGQREVDLRTLKLAHPPGLSTRPLFDRPDNPRRKSHTPATGRFEFLFNRSGRVAQPHAHGTWPMLITMADDQGQAASTTIGLAVVDVPPVVAGAQASPQFVHRGDGASIDVTVRVTDPNGADDIIAVSVDATAAGGGVYTTANGLTEVARGPDWIDFKLDNPFSQTDEVGRHSIPVTVTDETGTKTGATFLNVGNLAPMVGGHGLLYDADSVVKSGDPSVFVLVPPKGLCPNDHFRAGLIASDPEGDLLTVTGTIVETGATVTFEQKSEKVWVVDMNAPPRPGTYTLRMTVSETPADKEATVEMKITVVDCGDPPEDDPANAGDIAAPTNAPDVAAAPRDPSSQLLFGEIIGGMIGALGQAAPPVPGAGSRGGPSVDALMDSIVALLPVGTDGLPPVETYVIATGGSTGPVAQMFAMNRSGSPLRFNPQAVVLEPVAISADVQARVTELLQGFIAAGGQAVTLNAYCLEFLRKPPAAGTLLRIASAGIAAPFAGHADILGTARRLQDAGLLNPDSDPEEYLHAVRQWAIWTSEERFDARGFERAFLEKTRGNLAAAGTPWNDEVEQAVRALIPNRWNDIQQVLEQARIRAN